MQRFDLGAYTRRISTISAEAQGWFNAGFNWCYAFNKAEGLNCFRKALEQCDIRHPDIQREQALG
jgi:hypothetical protein